MTSGAIFLVLTYCIIFYFYVVSSLDRSIIICAQFRSPEESRDEVLTEKVDIYSLASVMFVVLTGKSPYFEQVGDYMTYTDHHYQKKVAKFERQCQAPQIPDRYRMLTPITNNGSAAISNATQHDDQQGNGSPNSSRAAAKRSTSLSADATNTTVHEGDDPAIQAIVSIIQQCHQCDPTLRPSANEIVAKLSAVFDKQDTLHGALFLN
jgi:serine/threonine protein kinase